MVKITDLKSSNIHQVRICFYDNAIWTKNELADKAKLSLASTTNVLQLLLNNNEINYVGEAKSTGGRKSKQYVLNADYCHLGMIMLKRDNLNHYIMVRSCDLFGNIILNKKIVSEAGTLIEILEIIETLTIEDDKISILTLSIPGVSREGKIDICDFNDLEQVDLGAIIKERFALAVTIGNDVNVGAIGFSGQYSKNSNLVLMYQPKVKYIGCGIIINHQLYNGYSNFAGELSYLPFISHKQQDQLLKDNPHLLLLKQLVSICCVINPEIIGVCSDVLESFDEHEVAKYIPHKHCPKIVKIKDLDALIYNGLYTLGREVLKNKFGKRENNGKVY